MSSFHVVENILAVILMESLERCTGWMLFSMFIPSLLQVLGRGYSWARDGQCPPKGSTLPKAVPTQTVYPPSRDRSNVTTATPTPQFEHWWPSITPKCPPQVAYW